jgi:hypothetical protein
MMRSRSLCTWANWKWLLVGLVLAGCDSNSSKSSGPGRDADVEPGVDAAVLDGGAADDNSHDQAVTRRDASASNVTPTTRDAASAGHSEGDGAPTEPGQTTEVDASTADPDVGGTAGSDGGSSQGNTGPDNAKAVPEGTLLYVYRQTPDNDLLVALDLETGDEVVITDLKGDGSSGWQIEGFALSPDRRRITLASLYAPTQDDVETGLATRAIWTLAADGSDFQRLTPTFPNDSQGREGFQYSVDYPEWTADGSQVVYNFGTYWWEGTDLEGGTFPWIVDANGASLPTNFTTSAPCTVIHPARNPVSGDFLFIHSVCVPGQGEGDGLYLYPADGSSSPQKLVASTHAEGGVDVMLRKAAWFPDASGFLFMGGTAETDWRASLLIYDVQDGAIYSLVSPPANASVYGATMNADASQVVYCVRDDDGNEDLRLIDLSAASPTDIAITTDGKSCDPSF